MKSAFGVSAFTVFFASFTLLIKKTTACFGIATRFSDLWCGFLYLAPRSACALPSIDSKSQEKLNLCQFRHRSYVILTLQMCDFRAE
jgi:hypothetical protein